MSRSTPRQRADAVLDITNKIVNFTINNSDRDLEQDCYKDQVWQVFVAAFSQGLCAPLLQKNGLSRPRRKPSAWLCYDTFILADRELRNTRGDGYMPEIGERLVMIAEWWHEWSYICGKPEVSVRKRKPRQPNLE